MTADPLITCPECKGPVAYTPIRPVESAEEREVCGEWRCAQGHVLVQFLKPPEAAVEYGRELARRYGW